MHLCVANNLGYLGNLPQTYKTDPAAEAVPMLKPANVVSCVHVFCIGSSDASSVNS